MYIFNITYHFFFQLIIWLLQIYILHTFVDVIKGTSKVNSNTDTQPSETAPSTPAEEKQHPGEDSGSDTTITERSEMLRMLDSCTEVTCTPVTEPVQSAQVTSNIPRLDVQQPTGDSGSDMDISDDETNNTSDIIGIGDCSLAPVEVDANTPCWKEGHIGSTKISSQEHGWDTRNLEEGETESDDCPEELESKPGDKTSEVNIDT